MTCTERGTQPRLRFNLTTLPSRVDASVAHKYLAFDIETAKDFPDNQDWRTVRPLGICCIATQIEGEQPKLWHGGQSNSPAPFMSQSEVQDLVAYLLQQTQQGLILLTWNGASFDFEILAEESGLRTECSALAMDHVDMMFHFFCDRGYPLSLQTASEGMGLPGKSGGVSGVEAPKLWREGCFDAVLRYVAQDVTLNIALARACEQRRRLSWTSKRGRPMQLSLPGGWLKVRDAIRLPKPDTTGMNIRMSRSEMVRWM